MILELSFPKMELFKIKFKMQHSLKNIHYDWI